MFNRETMGRIARAEISVYDAMMAEIMAEKSARLRKYLRKHEVRNDGHPVRKEKRKFYEKELCYSCDPWKGYDHINKFRNAEKIRTDAEDWELEQDSIAEDKRNAELEEEYRELERRYRHERYMRNLNDWLQYA